MTYEVVSHGEGGVYDPGEERAMNEAYSDFMACSFDDNPNFEQYVIPGVNNWLRTCDNAYTMGAWDSLASDWKRSQIYSGTLWDLRESLGIY